MTVRVPQKYRNRCDHEVLGEDYVYPGHYTALAYMIVHNFESFADARKPTDFNHSEALGSIAIPGSGTNVAHTMDFLAYLQEGLLEVDDFFREANVAWLSEKLKEDDHLKGLQQAERCEAWLRANLKEWLSRPPSEIAPRTG